MSYRPDNQALDPISTKLIEDIETFDAAVKERIKCGEWKDEHIAEILDVSEKLNRLMQRLVKIAGNTW